MRLLFRNGVVHTGTGVSADLVAVEDGRIRYAGVETAAYDGPGNEAEEVDLGGALLAPAFVDAHAHAVLTGFGLTRLDLRGTRSLCELLDLVARTARRQPDGVLIGTGWEEQAWPERRPPAALELERSAPGRMVLLERRDCHSCVVSPALLAAVPTLAEHDGYDAGGRLERDARHAISDALGTLVGPEQRSLAARACVRAMAEQGVAGFHEAAAPHLGPVYEVGLVREAAAEAGLEVTVYWGRLAGAPGALAELRDLDAAGLAGDLNVDGAIGSRTAALRTPYLDEPDSAGHLELGPEEIAGHLEACTRAGVQGGFHCIGEAGLDAVHEGLLLLECRIGRAAIRAARHRLEHVEMASPALVSLLGELGVVASMQPAFDDLWGGPDRMYAARLGGRWRHMNPVGAMVRTGVPVALGSDTPVTPIDPWGGVLAAVTHRDEEQRVPLSDAFAAHTAGGWFAARRWAGRIEPGAPAHLAVWACPAGPDEAVPTLPRLGADLPRPELRALYVHGRPVRTGRETR